MSCARPAYGGPVLPLDAGPPLMRSGAMCYRCQAVMWPCPERHNTRSDLVSAGCCVS